MLPHYAVPYKNTSKFKNQMAHHLRFFRFSNRTHIEKNEDLSFDEFFHGEKKDYKLLKSGGTKK
jgi:hypothetical protein